MHNRHGHGDHWSPRRAHAETRELLNRMAGELHQLHKEMHIMTAALDRLKTEVTESRSATDSVLALVAGLAQQIRDNINDEAALTALADDLDAQQTSIANAVTANTPTPPAGAPGEPGAAGGEAGGAAAGTTEGGEPTT